MTTNVEKLRKIGILGPIREVIGAIDEYDTNMDDYINKLTIDDIMLRYSTYQYGAAYTWAYLKYIFDELSND